jgi:hypothetical protein
MSYNDPNPKPKPKRQHYRAASNAWAHLYARDGWKGRPHGVRWQALMRDQFTCQHPGCQHGFQGHPWAAATLEGDETVKLIGHHKTPHEGNEALFFDINNVLTLCTWCHSSHYQSAERKARDADPYNPPGDWGFAGDPAPAPRAKPKPRGCA